MPPAARVTDMHTCPMVTGVVPHVGGPILPPGCPTVLIGMMPAACVGDMATCVGPPDVIAMGSNTVLIGNMPAARMGDQTAHGGVIVLGCPTVLIGDSGGGGGGGSGATPPTSPNKSQPKSGGGGGGSGATPPTSPNKSQPKSFATAEKAAVAAMKAANPKSVKEGREYGGWVHKNSDGTFSYDPPVRGTKDGLTNMPAKGQTDVIWFHTHGAPDPGYDNENFSGAAGDKGYSTLNNADGYVATPSGAIKKYDPVTKQTTTLSESAPP